MHTVPARMIPGPPVLLSPPPHPPGLLVLNLINPILRYSRTGVTDSAFLTWTYSWTGGTNASQLTWIYSWTGSTAAAQHEVCRSRKAGDFSPSGGEQENTSLVSHLVQCDARVKKRGSQACVVHAVLNIQKGSKGSVFRSIIVETRARNTVATTQSKLVGREVQTETKIMNGYMGKLLYDS